MLEGILWEPTDGLPRAAVVVCHPHPKPPPPTLGGTMRNNVVHRIARGFGDAGLAVLRFNFRSVGASEGEHDGQGAEDGDLSAALDFWLAAIRTCRFGLRVFRLEHVPWRA